MNHFYQEGARRVHDHEHASADGQKVNRVKQVNILARSIAAPEVMKVGDHVGSQVAPCVEIAVVLDR